MAILCIAAVFVLVRYGDLQNEYRHNQLAQVAEETQKVQFTARVVEDVQYTDSGKRAVVQPNFVSSGKILLFLEQGQQIGYADTIEIVGELELPGTFDDFNYAEFLAKDRIYAVMYGPEIQLQEKAAYGNVLERVLGGIFFGKEKLRAVLHEHIVPPQSAILAALLLGDKGLLTDETGERLNRAGVRHITAISGMHVAVLTIYLVPLFIWFGLWRQQAFYIAMAVMIFFVVLTGLQASAVRAGIMGGMFLFGQHIGRLNVSLRALLLAAAGMLIINPMLGTQDVGFQLSFLAVLGIIIFLPIFLSLLPEKLPFREIMGMTVAAHIFTLPVLVFNFGQISVVSIVTNLLIVPILPFLMGLGFLFLAMGWIAGPLGFIFSLPVSLLLEYVLGIVDFFSQLPFAAVQTENLSLFWLAVFYIAVALFWWKFRKRKEFDFMP